MTAATDRLVRDLTETAARLVDQVIPDGEGACLGTSAILAYALSTHGIPTTAVHGGYDEHPHWWLQTDTLRIDATRAQFDGGPLIEVLATDRDEDPYWIERTIPSNWDRDQAVTEFARMFEHGGVGEQHGRRILAELEQIAELEGATR